MKVLVYPKDKNPYQEMLYQGLNQFDFRYQYLTGPSKSHTLNLFALFYSVFKARFNGYKIFHLHWLYTFKLPSNNKLFNNFFTRLFFSVYLVGFLLWLKLLGYKLVWTLHNLVPHENQFIDDIFISKLIFLLADSVIVHSESIKSELEKNSVSLNKVSTIPIGNYLNTYTSTKLPKDELRKKFKIENDSLVFLFFGLVRNYKGLDNLLPTFAKYLKLFPKNYLIIAGECNDKNLKNFIGKYGGKYSHIKLFLKYIPDNDIPLYFKLADFAILPYKRVTTSATAMLSLGLGVPLIAPDIGHFHDLPKNTGFFYKTNSDLYNSIVSASKDRKSYSKIRENALDFARSQNWDESSKQTFELYVELLRS